MPNERGRTHEHKALFRKQLSAQAFVSLCERRVQNQHMVAVEWALFSSVQLTAFAILLLTVIKQCCINASAPFWIGGGGGCLYLPVRYHAPNRDARTVPVQYEYIHHATPNKNPSDPSKNVKVFLKHICVLKFCMHIMPLNEKKYSYNIL